MPQPRVIARDHRDLLGEGLWWSAREDSVYWTDILGRKLHRLRLEGGQVSQWTMPEMIGWIIEREGTPGFIVGLQSGFARLTLDPLTLMPFHDPEPDLPDNRMNDAKADRWGRIWAGTMPVTADRPSGALYRLDPDGQVACIERDIIIANGPAICERTSALFHTDTGRATVYRFPIDARGELGKCEPFLVFDPAQGRPDGMTMDAEGGLWIAFYGGGRVSRFTPDGELDRSIALPASQITNCVFAGERLDRMFVTSAAAGAEHEPLAGALFEIEPGVRGLAPHRYRG
ncbi:SMP-30/gluconolactonase/LRE family protein [Sphingomonas sp.]|jgi:sugar lactone lactonase YvrE|uniref:SMP-30/gluconolactonase/LRE family protein n=1 Tax=Sphingomonas sp. TaxID=28214 RepID=UPI002D7F7034|nr:SMP-30/gluconolactonase/LRE family protein [Sphingomonas sp.]HEU0045903.1 SMP-30/gluconolactonase/LRE family protein [Sphingomonas sp.]